MSAEEVREVARSVADHPVIEHGARLGYAANGLLHLLIAWIGIQLALTERSETADQSGAFQTLAATAAGQVALWATGGGLILLALWQLTALVGWCVFAVALLAWVWFEVSGCDATHTRDRSTAIDPTRHSSITVVAVASGMSLLAVGFGLEEARERDGALAIALTGLSLLAVLLSWLLVHTMFILRYAHEYYIDPVGGIAFPGED